MGVKKESLDAILVPIGVGFIFIYHIWFLYRYFNMPQTTIMGFENHNKRAWVRRVMELDLKSSKIALSVISSNTSASTFLATVSLTLSSLIGAWISTSNNNIFQSVLIYGNTSASTIRIKYIIILISFLLAFSCFIQSTRCFIHANYIISMPNSKIPICNVEIDVIRGGEFWQLGLRALYFALIMMIWFFGPIPMFVSSVFMTVLLQHFDSNSTPLYRFETTLCNNERSEIASTSIMIDIDVHGDV